MRTPDALAAWCADGRWGPRRVRTTECWATLDAEMAYDYLLRNDPLTLYPGARGHLTWSLGGRLVSLPWELRRNHVGRPVRLLLPCPRCARLVSRVYLPTADTPALACRVCWGRSYESRQANYREVGLLRPWLTSRDCAGGKPRFVARASGGRRASEPSVVAISGGGAGRPRDGPAGTLTHPPGDQPEHAAPPGAA